MEVDLVEALKKKEQALSSAKPPSPAVSYVHGVHAVSGAGVAKWANLLLPSLVFSAKGLGDGTCNGRRAPSLPYVRKQNCYTRSGRHMQAVRMEIRRQAETSWVGVRKRHFSFANAVLTRRDVNGSRYGTFASSLRWFRDESDVIVLFVQKALAPS
jgi:hypothetical protein